MKTSISQLSDLTGFDRRTISKRLAHLDAEDKGTRGKWYESDSALRTLYAGDAGLDPQQERALLDAAKRRLADLEYAKRRGDLVPWETVDKALFTGVATMKSRLQGIAGQYSAIFAAESDAKKIEQILDAEIYAALVDISNTKVGERDGSA